MEKGDKIYSSVTQRISGELNINIDINIERGQELGVRLNKGKVMKYWSTVKRYLIDTGDIYEDEHLVHSECGLLLRDHAQAGSVYEPNSSDEFINKKLFQKSLTAAQWQRRKQEALESQVRNEIISETSEQRLKRFTRGYRRSQNMEIAPVSRGPIAERSRSSESTGSDRETRRGRSHKWGSLQLKTVIVPID
ncbi:AEL083C-Ap [Eremothecium gossypii ATCC 10895]|uniref:AEL083C-Ap n=1 Tax=Eremothecium gossypii (strain ATCC 10895 / CBS 109.51 / FGSC 9923 / NRRL Y-1056) TaxID=284811 RepID=D8FGC9_EREGS|nr:AEL083C-Ap [Eremothecium gossypii ATCC 10895]ADJ41772.1 AEL083C-Ap [Eremothecium gossypii ATCC 10895]AEY96905.1 FAEL083C-Ap [Eremothecium gossypii FDAG1]